MSNNFANIAIQRFFAALGGVLLTLLLAICALGYALYSQYNDRLRLEQESAAVRAAADELRQSSDDLTRLARLHATTGNEQHAQDYRHALAIRDGHEPRPVNYQQIYWDLPPAAREKAHPPGMKESMEWRLKQLPLTEEEEAWLLESKKHSDHLAAIEMSVLAAVAAAGSDEAGRERALLSLFADDYQQAKIAVMLPINNVLSSADTRYRKMEAQLSDRTASLFAVFGVVLTVFAAIVILMLFFVRRKVLAPVHHLIENIRSIRRGGEVDRRVFYFDELGTLARQFYSMKEQMDRSYQDMRMVSFTDSLTGLHNRHYFYQVADVQVRVASRNNQKMTMLICDVDHFKAVNDMRGHLVGDEALKHVANLIRESIRESDVCARFGGEEFIVLLNNADVDVGVGIGEKIRSNIEKTPCEHKGVDLHLTISIGAAELGKDGDINDAIDRADKALYDAKNSGRNRVSRN